MTVLRDIPDGAAPYTPEHWEAGGASLGACGPGRCGLAPCEGSEAPDLAPYGYGVDERRPHQQAQP